jgi:hypothetical protein
MNINSVILKSLQSFDPQDEAETFLGRPLVKGREADDFTMLSFALDGIKAETSFLESIKDTTFNTRAPEFLGFASSLGFEDVWSLKFPHVTTDGVVDESIQESFHVMANRKSGVFLVLETYTHSPDATPAVNKAQVFYCWKPNNIKVAPISSGAWRSVERMDWEDFQKEENAHKLFFCGYADVRKGFRTHLETLEAVGTFYPQWPTFGGRRVLHLTHWVDYKIHSPDGDFSRKGFEILQALEHERFNSFPEWAKEIVNGNMGEE